MKLPEEYHVIIDEFHNVMFEDEVFDLLGLLKNAESLLALSGSPLEREHSTFLE